MRELVLASGSPRRHQLLKKLGVPFRVVHPGVDEFPEVGETPVDFVSRTAGEKSASVAGKLSGGAALILAADTVVSIEGRILGKPADRGAAVEMLRSLSDRVHSVYTAVVLFDAAACRVSFRVVDETRVWFRQLSEDEIDRFLDVEPVMDKAGAYAIQGRAGSFIPRILGNYSNVVGLPLPVVFDTLQRAGLA